MGPIHLAPFDELHVVFGEEVGKVDLWGDRLEPLGVGHVGRVDVPLVLLDPKQSAIAGTEVSPNPLQGCQDLAVHLSERRADQSGGDVRDEHFELDPVRLGALCFASSHGPFKPLSQAPGGAGFIPCLALAGGVRGAVVLRGWWPSSGPSAGFSHQVDGMGADRPPLLAYDLSALGGESRRPWSEEDEARRKRVARDPAASLACAVCRPWPNAKERHRNEAMPKRAFRGMGLASLLGQRRLAGELRTAGCRPARPVVRERGEGASPKISDRCRSYLTVCQEPSGCRQAVP